MPSDTVRQATNVVALVATVAVNALANALPLNGQTTGEISDRFPVYITPAGYVFSIWGLIYLGLISFVVYQALPAQRANPRLRRVGYLFALSCAANIGWLLLWHYNFITLSLAAMIILLITLIAIYERLEIGRSSVSGAERWLVRAPFSIYLGWISVATIVNATVTLYNLGWGGGGVSEEAWTAILLAAAVLIAATVLRRRGDIAYGLVIVWAAAGIAVKHAGTPPVALAAGLAAAAVALALAAWLVRQRMPPGPGRLSSSSR